jgi:hypothetical protein
MAWTVLLRQELLLMPGVDKVANKAPVQLGSGEAILMRDPITLLFEGTSILEKPLVFPEPAGLGNLEIL